MSESSWQSPGQQPGPDGARSNPGYPITAGLNAPSEIARWRVIGNPILAIPHMVLLYILQLVTGVAVFVAWFIVLFTGQIPDGIGNFVAGVHRYQWRVISYILFLREPYPAFGVPGGYADPGGDPAWLQISPPQHFNRLAVLLRFIFIIPQALFGIVLGIAAYLAVIVAFFAVLIVLRLTEQG